MMNYRKQFEEETGFALWGPGAWNTKKIKPYIRYIEKQLADRDAENKKLRDEIEYMKTTWNGGPQSIKYRRSMMMKVYCKNCINFKWDVGTLIER